MCCRVDPGNKDSFCSGVVVGNAPERDAPQPTPIDRPQFFHLESIDALVSSLNRRNLWKFRSIQNCGTTSQPITIIRAQPGQTAPPLYMQRCLPIWISKEPSARIRNLLTVLDEWIRLTALDGVDKDGERELDTLALFVCE
jgi:hypothetical protein